MAEILLSLTIIGVVAAITLPSLTGNINERTWNTQRKALYARFSQAIALMPALNGYGTLTEESSAGASDAVDTAAETFVTDGLSKVMKINNICDSDHLEDCGIPAKFSTLGGIQKDLPLLLSTFNPIMVGSYSTKTQSISLIDTKPAAFETQNGESIIVYYNPQCIGNLQEITLGGTDGYFVQNKVCANFVYDLNGLKGPNTVGKDIGFMTAMYPSDIHIVAPMPAINPLQSTYTLSEASRECSNLASEYRLPNADEIISLFVNKELLKGNGVSFSAQYWSSTKIKSTIGLAALVLKSSIGQLDDRLYTGTASAWCIKR